MQKKFNLYLFNQFGLLIFINMKYHLYFFALIGGVFKLELFLPEEYPMAAPKVKQLSIGIPSIICILLMIDCSGCWFLKMLEG